MGCRDPSVLLVRAEGGSGLGGISFHSAGQWWPAGITPGAPEMEGERGRTMSQELWTGFVNVFRSLQVVGIGGKKPDMH